jgi:pseudouridine-5'-phosphate glycosidase
MNNNKNAGIKTRLLRKIQPILKPFGIRKETIIDAIEKSLIEIKRGECDVHTWLTPLVLQKIFRVRQGRS